MRALAAIVVLLSAAAISCGRAAADQAAEPAPGCTKASQCDDVDPCTKEVCTPDRTCLHLPVADCRMLGSNPSFGGGTARPAPR